MLQVIAASVLFVVGTATFIGAHFLRDAPSDASTAGLIAAILALVGAVRLAVLAWFKQYD